MLGYLQILTNIDIPVEQQKRVLADASKLTSSLLGKPESYVMVSLQPKVPMLFGGTDAPTAFLALKSVRLPATRTAEFSSKLCSFIEQQLQIPKDRICIEFVSPEGSMWGWRGGGSS